MSFCFCQCTVNEACCLSVSSDEEMFIVLCHCGPESHHQLIISLVVMKPLHELLWREDSEEARDSSVSSGASLYSPPSQPVPLKCSPFHSFSRNIKSQETINLKHQTEHRNVEHETVLTETAMMTLTQNTRRVVGKASVKQRHSDVER